MPFRLILLCAGMLLSFGCSREQAPPAPLPAQAETAPVSEPRVSREPAGILEQGESYYRSICASCHDSGAGGAPIVGDATIWKSRIDQGLETLVYHAIEGFKGSACVMPPRGGDAGMQVEAVALAVRYMVEQGLPPEARADPKPPTRQPATVPLSPDKADR